MDTTEKRTPYAASRGVRDGSVTMDKLADDVKEQLGELSDSRIANIEKTASSDADGGVNTWTITQANGETVDISVKNGETGATGPQGASAVFDPETGNILATLENTTGTSDSNAMTQKAVTEELIFEGASVNLSSYTKKAVYIDSSQEWHSGSTTSGSRTNCIFVPVTPGIKYKMQAQTDRAVVYAFLTSDSYTAGNSVSTFAGGTSSRVVLGANKETLITIPTGTNYLYLTADSGGSDALPSVVKVVTTVKEEIVKAKTYESTLGTSTTKTISQKAITDEFSNVTLVKSFERFKPYFTASGVYISSGQYKTATTGASASGSYIFTNSTTVARRGQYIKVIPQSGNYVRVAFLVGSINAGDTVVYSSVISGVYTTDTDVAFEAYVPNDADYIWIQSKRSGVDIAPAKVEFFERKTIDDINTAVNTIKEVVIDSYTSEDIYPGGCYINSTSATTYTATISSKSGGYLSNYSSKKARGKIIRLTPQEDKFVQVAFVTAKPTASGTITYATGGTLKGGTTLANAVLSYTVPEDTEYIYLLIKSDSVDVTPALIEILEPNATINTALSKVEDVNSELSHDVSIMSALSEELNLSTMSYISTSIDVSTNKWTSSNTAYMIKTIPGEVYVIKKTGSYECRYALLLNSTAGSNNTLAEFHPDLYGVQSFNNTNDPTHYKTITIPDGCVCLYVYRGGTTSARPYEPDKIFRRLAPTSIDLRRNYELEAYKVCNEFRRLTAIGPIPIPTSIQLDADDWEVPTTLQQLNAIKIANRHRFFKWTPKATVPGPQGRNYTANVQQTRGVPYSNNLQDLKWVGVTVSFYSFLTAVNNPYSLLYTENVDADNSASAWGRTYWNFNGYSYYGNVCCTFTAAATGMSIVAGNGDFASRSTNYAEFSQLTPAGVVHPELLQIGDVFDSDSHSIMIYGIKRDTTTGEVTHVRIAEQTRGGGTDANRFYIYPISYFVSYVAGTTDDHVMTHYRCNKLYENYRFTPLSTDPTNISLDNTHIHNGSANSGTDSSSSAEQTDPTMSNEICTFAGDKVSFAQGDLVVINYNLNADANFAYTKIKVYKDGSLFNTYTIADIDETNFDASQVGHALSLGTTLAGGKYYAVCATDDDESTEKTEWEVIGDESYTVDLVDDDVHVSFTKPCHFLTIGRLDTSYTEPRPRGSQIIIPTFKQKEEGHIATNIRPRIGKNYTINDLYVFITLEGDYGIVRCKHKLT